MRVPWLDGAVIAKAFEHAAGSGGGGLLNMANMFTGDAMRHGAVGALGIMPYISSTIIIQLLTAVIPTLSKLAREEGGRTKIVQYGRYGTVLLCLVQGGAMAVGWENPSGMFGTDVGQLVLVSPANIWWYRIATVILLTTGTMLLMWLGEQITERGIGNGVSLVITIGIVSRLPVAAKSVWFMFFPPGGVKPTFNVGHGAALFVLLLLVVAGVIAVTQAQRKIPVQYAQRAVGRKMYSGGTSFMPLRVNYAGVMPVIFASAILTFIGMLAKQIAGWKILSDGFIKNTFMNIGNAVDRGHATYLILFGLMILAFSYFWVATQFNEIQIADDLKKNNGLIPGVRPGQQTSDYLHNTMSRITLAGALILTLIAVIPIIMQNFMSIPRDVADFFGGTTILITVGVMLDTMRQVESHLMMRNYDGFLKKGKIRGRL